MAVPILYIQSEAYDPTELLFALSMWYASWSKSIVISGTAEASGDCYEVDPDIVKDCRYEMIFNKEKLSVDCQTAIDSLRTLFNMEKARRIKRIDQVGSLYHTF